VLDKEGTAPILGLDSVERIDQAVDALTISLTKEEVQFLEEPYAPNSSASKKCLDCSEILYP
jgi:aryl-alcohol dehydrogenase-like predicted oxidoreductase